MNYRHLVVIAAISTTACSVTEDTQQPRDDITPSGNVSQTTTPRRAELAKIASASTPQAALGSGDSAALEEAIVTGSYIRRDNFYLPSPISDPTPAPVAPTPSENVSQTTISDSLAETAPASAPQLALRSREGAATEAITVTGSYIRGDRPGTWTSVTPGVASRASARESRHAVHHPLLVQDREMYSDVDENGFKLVTEHPVSTFSVDVDTASYANVRRFLNGGQLPPTGSVRVEEMINYFSYAYDVPATSTAPFSITTEMAANTWQQDRHLLMVGLKGFEREASDLPPANLVFLVDTSGSMRSRNKLELVKASLKMLATHLDAEDRISIVVYAGSAGVVLEPTPGDQTGRLHRALEQLQAGGSTNGGAGIELAYHLAEDAYIDGGINRVILATDGDFNVGVTSQVSLREMVEAKRKGGVSLTVLGYGVGNYNDAMMQEIAQIGNGNAAYIDSLNEARKVLVDEMSSTFETIAKDVKIQIEFNPATVSEYRLVGYETRRLNREDFNNDKVDAGDIGAGHTVTALYEVTLAGSGHPSMDPLRYGADDKPATQPGSTEIAHIKLRYKQPDSSTSKLISRVVNHSQVLSEVSDTSENYRFSVAVAAFGQLLKGGKYTSTFGFADVLTLAQSARGTDNNGYRGEFINLVKTAQALGNNVSQR